MEAIEVAEHLIQAIHSHSPDFEQPRQKLHGWARAIDQALRLDSRTPEQLKAAIDWAHRSDEGRFWRSNILSGKALREKFHTLRIQAKQSRDGPARVGNSRGVSSDDIAGMAVKAREEEQQRDEIRST